MINHQYLFLPLLASALVAGEPPPAAKNPLPADPKPPDNPLSFFDGRLVFDLQERLRGEVRENNFDFNDSVDALTDDAWLLQRFRFGIKVKPWDWLTIYAQGQDVREFGSDRPNVIGQLGAEGDDSFDLRQGYVEIGDPKKMSLKVGRQVLAYGDERLVGPGDWLNQSRTFDAIKFHFEQPTWSIDAFTSSVVKFNQGRFNESDWLDDDDTRSQFFTGIYFSTTALDFQTTDLYAFELHEEGAADTDFVTLGTRWKGNPKKLSGWDYEVEMAVQAGDLKGKNLAAFAGHWGAGHVWDEAPWKPRLFVEYNFATGDGNAADGEVNTFQNLFPTNHKFYGYMDVFSWQNMHNPGVAFSVQPMKNLTARLDYHLFWLADTSDAWYRANGTTAVRPITPAAASFAGSEVDFTVTWKPKKWFGLQAGYSHFFAGNYLDETGAGDDADFGYLQATFEF
ncbi:MAG: alginate export family protein [Verrucomicrobiales bacterium]